MLRRGCCKASQGERWREDVLTETRIRIFGIKGIDQPRIMRFHRSAGRVDIERGCTGHLAGNPALPDGTEERFVGCDHECTLYNKLLHVNSGIGISQGRGLL